jgi:hypothetical protein
MTTPARPRLLLGDVLLKQKRLSPYQLGVALDVQRRTKLPIGQILVGANILSVPRLRMALLWQRLLRLFSRTPSTPLTQGAQLPDLARARLRQHMQTFPNVPVASYEIAHTMKLRRERASLSKGSARIVEQDDIVRQRLLTGNF